jgi:hypothetical protein
VIVGIVSVKSSGNTNNLEAFLKEMQANSMFDMLESEAQRGVEALEAATPRRSGVTASSWYYEITTHGSSYTITWMNSNRDPEGVQIVIMLQYGHATGTDGYVQGLDFINPVTKVIFDDIEDAVWKAVQSA